MAEKLYTLPEFTGSYSSRLQKWPQSFVTPFINTALPDDFSAPPTNSNRLYFSWIQAALVTCFAQYSAVGTVRTVPSLGLR